MVTNSCDEQIVEYIRHHPKCKYSSMLKYIKGMDDKKLQRSLKRLIRDKRIVKKAIQTYRYSEVGR